MKKFLITFYFCFFSILLAAVEPCQQLSTSTIIKTAVDMQLIEEDTHGNTYILSFDSDGHVAALEQKDSAGVRISSRQMKYDARGNKIAEIYQVLGRSCPVKAYAVEWEFNDQNQLTSINEGASSQTPRQTKYLYDEAGRMTTLIKPDGMQLHISYASNGKICQLSSADMTICYSYIYDEQAHLIKAIDHHSSSTTERTYDHAGRMLTETLGNGLTLTYSYDEGHQKLTLPDGSAIKYIYNQHALETVIRLAADGQEVYQAQAMHSQAAEDALEKLFFEKEAFANKTLKQEYTYDTRGQITEERGHTNCSYTYDSLKNRLSLNGKLWKIDAHNQLIKTDTESFEWDQNGNCVSRKDVDAAVHFSFDALNRLVAVIWPKEKSVHFTYDPFHRRLSKTCFIWDQQQWLETESLSYLYEGEKEIGAVDSQGNLVQLRLLKKGFSDIGAALAIEIKGRSFQPLHDASGSIIALLDLATKALQEVYCYTAFGEMQIFDANGVPQRESLCGNPWLYFSKRHDKESNVFFFGMRYYSPNIGRWLSADPMGFVDNINRFVFLHNDPAHYTDLYGLFSIRDVWGPGINLLDALYDTVANYCHTFRQHVSLEANLLQYVEEVANTGFGAYFGRLIGLYEETCEAGVVGSGELDDKVRITFVNGILNIKIDALSSAQMISASHGNTNVHYIFRPTLGWSWDLLKSIFVKSGYVFPETELLAATWRKLIDEMGGVNSGGYILHYAHSIGSADTYTAKTLLTAEEQKMIKVVTFGSPSLLPSDGFHSVTHYISVRDGVPLLDFGNRLVAFFNGHEHIIPIGDYFGIPFFDHLLNSATYRDVIERLGKEFFEKIQPPLAPKAEFTDLQ